ncbi:hypothetical protein BY996DRAFT_8396263 [Phakopsora pachyrhizi]|nr:hypothetical protein BY996DRAFT_8396263 [Phakopsora pachyrhizi]
MRVCMGGIAGKSLRGHWKIIERAGNSWKIIERAGLHEGNTRKIIERALMDAFMMACMRGILLEDIIFGSVDKGIMSVKESMNIAKPTKAHACHHEDIMLGSEDKGIMSMEDSMNIARAIRAHARHHEVRNYKPTKTTRRRLPKLHVERFLFDFCKLHVAIMTQVWEVGRKPGIGVRVGPVVDLKRRRGLIDRKRGQRDLRWPWSGDRGGLGGAIKKDHDEGDRTGTRTVCWFSLSIAVNEPFRPSLRL